MPALIYHMERSWSARIDGPKHHLQGFTAMGVRFREGKKCSGVLIEVDEEELAQFDIREKGYDRKLIELEHIHRIPNLGDDLNDQDHVVFHRSESARRRSSVAGSAAAADDKEDEINDQEETVENVSEDTPEAFLDTTLDIAEEDDVRVWVYLQKEHKAANKDYPIQQSYVDIIMRGCLSISQGFARSFLDTTSGWHHNGDGGDVENICFDSEGKEKDGATCDKAQNDYDGDDIDDDHHTWILDRHVDGGLYVRSHSDYSNSFGHEIDALVREHHPEALDKRRAFEVDGKNAEEEE